MEKSKNASMSSSPLVPHFTNFGISCTRYSPIAELSLTSKVPNDEADVGPLLDSPVSKTIKNKLSASESFKGERREREIRQRHSYQNMQLKQTKSSNPYAMSCTKTTTKGNASTPTPHRVLSKTESEAPIKPPKQACSKTKSNSVSVGLHSSMSTPNSTAYTKEQAIQILKSANQDINEHTFQDKVKLFRGKSSSTSVAQLIGTGADSYKSLSNVQTTFGATRGTDSNVVVGNLGYASEKMPVISMGRF